MDNSVPLSSLLKGMIFQKQAEYSKPSEQLPGKPPTPEGFAISSLAQEWKTQQTSRSCYFFHLYLRLHRLIAYENNVTKMTQSVKALENLT